MRIPPGLEGVSLVFGVAGHVEPVPGPAFAVVPGLQQPIDDAAERARLIVVDERFDLFRSRRQTGQSEGDPAD